MTQKTIQNPHDKFFKTTFARKDTARSFLQTYLPANIVPELDFSTFEISKDTFVDEEFKDTVSDILYKVGLRSGGQAYIYVLFEHKSYEDRLVALQILKYMNNIWDLQRQQNEDLKLKLKYPIKPILPLLVYHGLQGWQIDTNFMALFDPKDLPDSLKPYLPNFNYFLVDLSQYSDDQIKGEVILQLGLLLLKYIYRGDLKETLTRIFPLFYEVLEKETGLEYIEMVLRYLTDATGKITETELKNILTEVYAEGETIMQTIAQTWLEQGEKIGIIKGEKRGEKKGERKATLEALHQILTIRFEAGLKKFDESLNQLDLKSLKHLNEIALKVNSLADFEKVLTDMPRKKQGKASENKPKPDENETSA